MVSVDESSFLDQGVQAAEVTDELLSAVMGEGFNKAKIKNQVFFSEELFGDGTRFVVGRIQTTTEDIFVILIEDADGKGITRGDVTTTKGNPALPCPEDKVNRKFKAPAPNILWVADFTYVRTAVWFVYVAFTIDVFARYIVGWKVSSSMPKALAARQPDPKTLIHHSDRGVQYSSIKYTERLEEAKIDPSVGSVGDSYDNAMAETINGLYKGGHRTRGSVARQKRGRFCHTRMGPLVQSRTSF